MDECKPIKTPMPTNGHLNLDEGGNTVDQTLYRSMIRYLKHTPGIGLWYPKGAIFELVGYYDSDYAGCKVDRKAHPEGAICLVDHLCLGPQRSKIVWF